MRLRFTIRDLRWLTLAVALGFSAFAEHKRAVRLASELDVTEAQLIKSADEAAKFKHEALTLRAEYIQLRSATTKAERDAALH